MPVLFVLKTFDFSTLDHFLLLVWTPPLLWVIWLLLQVMWWIIHWVFCNWDLLNLADGALVLSPLQACATYGKLMPTSLFAICSFWTERLPSSLKLKGQTLFCFYRCTLDFLPRYDQFEDTCHQPAVQLIMYTPIRVHPRKRTLSNWLAEKQPRQTLIGIEWDCSVCQRSDFANVRARI